MYKVAIPSAFDQPAEGEKMAQGRVLVRKASCSPSADSSVEKLPKLVAKTSCASRRSRSTMGDGESLHGHTLDTLKVWNSRWSNKHDLANAIKRVKEKYGDSILSE